MRRCHILILLSLLTVTLLSGCFKTSKASLPLEKTEAEWRTRLPAERYYILFQDGTEIPESSPLNHEHRHGTYICAACHQPLFTSATKYDSGTGWPSFWDAIPGALKTRTDIMLYPLLIRTEYYCSRCGGHQGHVFNDGPGPTYKRYCNNGLALIFVPQGEKLPELVT